MADYPALPLWTDAYLADTTHLSVTESGAYLHLLMAAWRSPTCALPNDDRIIARMARCNMAQWRHIRAVVLAFWTVSEDGKFLTQKRLHIERFRVNEKSKSQQKKANAKWLKTHNMANAAASAGHMPNACRTDPTISISSITPISPLEGDHPEKGSKQRKGTRLGMDWQATDQHRKAARAKGLGYAETELEIGGFKTYYTVGPGRNKTFSDWERAWLNWCDKAISFGGGRLAKVNGQAVVPRPQVAPTKDTPREQLRNPNRPWYDDDNQPDYAALGATGTDDAEW